MGVEGGGDNNVCVTIGAYMQPVWMSVFNARRAELRSCVKVEP